MGLVERYAAVRKRIAQAALRSGRQTEDITLVAVSKTWPAEVVVAGYDAGLRNFGENRIEELVKKRPEVEDILGNERGIVWHAIGTIQSRKSRLAAENADVIHALDRLKLADRLSRHLVELGRNNNNQIPVFLEVNVSGEASKAGLDCSRWEHDASQRAAARELALAIDELPGLHPMGLMTMAPWGAQSQEIREIFRRTRELAEWMQTATSQTAWSCLSMGMTDDFEIAIEEGATHVRIGRALFGDRH